MKIIADSSSLYSTKEANSKGFTILPVAVTLNGKSYKDYDEITSDKLLSQIVQGAIPKSSQPAIGEILDTFTSTDEEIVMLTVGDGLSGTYSNAVGAKNSLDTNEHIHIIDTQTLAGAFHYLVDKANTLKNEGKTIILSTHIFSLVEKLCDRVGIIIDGKMVVSDTLEKITKDKNLEDAFFDLYFAKGGVLNE